MRELREQDKAMSEAHDALIKSWQPHSAAQ